MSPKRVYFALKKALKSLSQMEPNFQWKTDPEQQAFNFPLTVHNRVFMSFDLEALSSTYCLCFGLELYTYDVLWPSCIHSLCSGLELYT